MTHGQIQPIEVAFEPTGPSALPEPRARRFSPAARLKAALAASVVVVAVLAGALYATRYQSATEREMSAAIEAYSAAWNAHDRDAVVAAMAPGARFAAGETLERPLVTAYAGNELDKLLSSMFGASVALKTTGRVTIAGDDTSHATVTQQFRYQVRGIQVAEDGISLYTLAPVNGKLKVAQHMWWRPRAPGAPSMLWLTGT
jgi:hypothetical protein